MRARLSVWSLLKSAALGWVDDRCPSMGAAIAYYAIFSLAPLLILAIALAGLLFGREAAQGAIVAQLTGLMGKEGAAAIQALIEGARDQEAGIVASVIGIATLIFGASGAFAEIQGALNIIWKARSPDRSVILGVLRQRMLSLSLVAVVGFLLLASLIVSAALTALDDYLYSIVTGLEAILQVVNLLVSFGAITVLFAMIFKILPDAAIAWRDVWLGAAVTALLFTVAKFLIGLYIGSGSVLSSYGAGGALVVILLWVYYSSQIMLFGAEITRAYADRRGAHGPRRGQNPLAGTQRSV